MPGHWLSTTAFTKRAAVQLSQGLLGNAPDPNICLAMIRSLRSASHAPGRLVRWGSSLVQSGPWRFEDDMSLTHAHCLDATLSGHLPTPSEARVAGSPATPGSHLVFFNHTYPESTLSGDGYDNTQAPSGDFPNRRWYGGSVAFNINSTLKLGEQAVCDEFISDVRESGDGKRVSVTIEREMRNTGSDTWAVRERRSMFYFGQDSRLTERQFKHIAAKYTPTYTHIVQPSRILLFRYSALNFNSHLIHYDTIYSRTQENLPEVIVQGPLMVTMALWWFSESLLKQSNSARRISSFTYRNLAPMTVEESARLCAAPITQDLFEVWIENPRGGVVLSGQMVLQ